MADFAAAVTRALGRQVDAVRPLSGGDVAEAYRVELADGERVFAKTRRSSPPGFFVTEATGLAWLRGAGAIPVPEVLHVSDDPPLLVLEWIDEGRARAGTEASLGRALARLHASGAPCFGREDRRTTGSRGLPNEPCASFVEFYAGQRLLPLVKLAHEADALPASSLRALEDVAQRLADLAGPPEPPARLHGDLWGGNRLVDADGESWLIDPAAHGGHREFDLAMMRLFGGFGEACFAAYAEASPLAPGWEERVPLFQLAPLVVHAIKFGGGYAAATRRALAAL
ncbi:MAG: fructosamine kinase family protein [Myxococcota bacterium]